MKKSTKAKVLAAGLGVATLFGATGCDNETTQEKCQCPNGTVHVEPDITCCDGINCTCVIQYNGIFDGNIPMVIYDYSKELGQPRADQLKSVLSGYAGINKSIIKNKIPTIVVNKAPEFSGYKTEENTIYLDIDSENIEDDLGLALNDVVAFNKQNSNIRLVNGRDMNAKAGWVAYQRGFSRMAQQWVKNSKIHGT
jgi:hypothetical protein